MSMPKHRAVAGEYNARSNSVAAEPGVRMPGVSTEGELGGLVPSETGEQKVTKKMDMV